MLIWRPACGGTAAFGSWAGPHGECPRTARRARGAAVPGGEGRPALPGAQFPTRRWAEGGKLNGRGGWRSPWPLRQRLSPFRASSGLSLGSRFPRSQRFRSSPPGEAVNYPPRPDPPGRPPEPGRGRGAAGGRGVRLAATRGQRPQLDRPPPARRRGLNAVNQSISPRSPPRNPERRPPGLLCVSPACLPGAWEAGPGRCRVRGARRVPTSGRGGLKATLSCPTR